jgi:hypothetical protein
MSAQRYLEIIEKWIAGSVGCRKERLREFRRACDAAVAPSFGVVRLRAFAERDVGMLMDLSTDP